MSLELKIVSLKYFDNFRIFSLLKIFQECKLIARFKDPKIPVIQNWMFEFTSELQAQQTLNTGETLIQPKIVFFS